MANHSSGEINAAGNISPIETKGNWFWKDSKRFLIKGVPYEPRNSSLPGPESRINPLSDDWLENLRKDIPFFHRLGINTMFIECADATQSPRQAMQLLQNEGIYVLLKLDTDLVRGDSGQLKAAKINIARMYSPDEVRKNLAIVRQTARFSIVRGYKISQSKIWTDATTKLAALHRAAVRDTKLFLKKLGLRPIPVGSSMSSDQMYRLNVIRYMTAGSPEERVDFISFGVYDWVGPSSFQMSGYKHLIKAFEAFPVPMFWGDDPESNDVSDDGDDNMDAPCYDLVQITDRGERAPKKDFERFQQNLAVINAMPQEDIVGSHEVKDYDSWRGSFKEGKAKVLVGNGGGHSQLPDRLETYS
ncbi:uncharacterized protein MYCGRDRAFT_107396 [Zymoseptoria tritici IPO323]|uniref:1,3-beta-glucanosyltransferase n=1 Tax=Zymoseptoria tritici (strain CBS 115943 / IPO323) TaxID=336722 RepID=F9X0C6_ZYMTI|nr:uncharacterized protein MYCGRDRAFT_107396 [Zymoseptoria tritici IPO323]EGP92185.1 hypothetical protein MYCGRDRAFT_107396 [Zymoseptoria tritici IPO323]